MKQIFSISVLAFLIAACNNAATVQTESTIDSLQTEAHNHADHAMNAVDNAYPLPKINSNAKVFFKNLKDGQTVSSPFTVEMGVEGITIEPAGEIKEGFGHHHILLDAGDSITASTVIPADSMHLHFGKGQTSAEVTLPKGKHRIALQVADGIHRSYGKQLSAAINIIVK